MFKPYAYQERVVEEARQNIRDGHRCQLIVMPTGGGKTMIGSMILSGMVKKNYRGMFYAHRTDLVDQSVVKLRQQRLHVGQYQANRPFDLSAPIQVASLQTFDSRVIRGRKVYDEYGDLVAVEKMPAPKAQVVIVDEAHLALGSVYRKIIQQTYKDAYVIGLTATPIRGDGQPMSDLFSAMVMGPTMHELIDEGVLVPTEVFVPSLADLEGVRLGPDGDFDPASLSKAMMGQKHLVGDAVREYATVAEGRSTIIFCPGIEHSLYVRDMFRAAGYRAEHIDHNTKKEERKEIFAKLESGEVTHLTNVNVLTEGFDSQRVSCIIDLAPTKNVGRFLQRMGRGLRAWRGGVKTECIIIDHAGNHYRHGQVTLDREWNLDDGEGEYKERARELQERQPRAITCPMCHKVYNSSPSCPRCGFEQTRDERGFPLLGITEGQLKKLEERELIRVGSKVYDRAERKAFYAGLKHHAAIKGYGRSWVNQEFQAKFKIEAHKTAYNTVEAAPYHEIDGWIRHRNIRKARSKKGVAAQQ